MTDEIKAAAKCWPSHGCHPDNCDWNWSARNDACILANAYLAERVWQPIATAPKNGKIILLYRPLPPGNWQMATGCWHIDECWIFDGRPMRIWEHPPTHWQPLPEPPKEEEGK